MNTAGAQARLEELLRKLGFDARVTAGEADDKLVLSVESAHHALLIGKGGETLRSMQQIFNAMQRQAGEDFVTIDIAGYRKEREAKLELIAQEAADRARLTKAKVHLKPMNAYERRQVHMVLADMPDIVTTSEGEEPHRVIMVQLRET
jgi:spoIIIJ-associated protein